MKTKIFLALLGAALLVGCTEQRQNMGAAADNDHNVMTGGPIIGTTINDLPQNVKETLQKQVPHAEIANINKTTRKGVTLYEISFTQPGENPKVYITEDGKVLDQSEIPQK